MRRKKAPEPVTLGNKYRDVISGFEGITTGRFEFLHGCVRVQLEMGKDGKCEEFVFDEQRLIACHGAPVKPTATSGGPRLNPPSRDPVR